MLFYIRKQRVAIRHDQQFKLQTRCMKLIQIPTAAYRTTRKRDPLDTAAY